MARGASTGKGRGRQVIATAKSCDIILMVLDPTKDDAQKEMLTKERLRSPMDPYGLEWP